MHERIVREELSRIQAGEAATGASNAAIRRCFPRDRRKLRELQRASTVLQIRRHHPCASAKHIQGMPRTLVYGFGYKYNHRLADVVPVRLARSLYDTEKRPRHFILVELAVIIFVVGVNQSYKGRLGRLAQYIQGIVRRRDLDRVQSVYSIARERRDFWSGWSVVAGAREPG